MKFDRQVYFDTIRPSFGSLSQSQVDGQNYILDFFERHANITDLRWFAYELATARHETASTMLPVEEYGYGKGHPYGEPHPETGQTYYGRGYVQLTWYDNYLYADEQLGLEGNASLVWFPDNALVPSTAARIMERGMVEGWFRDGHTLPRYFNDTTEDPYQAREIINGDKHIVPNWSGGVSIGQLVAEYYEAFLGALEKSRTERIDFVVRVIVPKGIRVVVEEGIG